MKATAVAPSDPYYVVSLEDRFWDRVSIGGPGCWEWEGSLTRWGYGQLGFRRKDKKTMLRAHRLMWLILRGDIPPGLCVCHTCDNRKCVRPSHLWLGTVGDNNRDTALKGRQWMQRKVTK